MCWAWAPPPPMPRLRKRITLRYGNWTSIVFFIYPAVAFPFSSLVVQCDLAVFVWHAIDVPTDKGSTIIMWSLLHCHHLRPVDYESILTSWFEGKYVSRVWMQFKQQRGFIFKALHRSLNLIGALVLSNVVVRYREERWWWYLLTKGGRVGQCGWCKYSRTETRGGCGVKWGVWGVYLQELALFLWSSSASCCPCICHFSHLI